jgi:hypothetical protein
LFLTAKLNYDILRRRIAFITWRLDLAGSGSYARGDHPRPVSDPDKAAYDAMAAKQKAHNARQEEAWYRQHPGLAESLVPVWGSGREAVADALEGDVVGATANGLLALTDLTGEGYVLKTLGKGGLKIGGSMAWKQVRKHMGDKGLLEAGQHGHHWLIPQREWGKGVPEIVKNQPWNIKGMKSPEIHARMRGATKGGKPRLNPIERYVEGTPSWWKVQNGVWAGHAAQGVEEGLNPAARDDRPPGRR